MRCVLLGSVKGLVPGILVGHLAATEMLDVLLNHWRLQVMNGIADVTESCCSRPDHPTVLATTTLRYRRCRYPGLGCYAVSLLSAFSKHQDTVMHVWTLQVYITRDIKVLLFSIFVLVSLMFLRDLQTTPTLPTLGTLTTFWRLKDTFYCKENSTKTAIL